MIFVAHVSIINMSIQYSSVAHPHFNFANNILHAVIPILTSYNTKARLIVKKCIEDVFKVLNLYDLVKTNWNTKENLFY